MRDWPERMVGSGVLFYKQPSYLRSFVRPSIDDLRGCIEGAPTEGLEEPVLLEDIGEAKVCNLGVGGK